MPLNPDNELDYAHNLDHTKCPHCDYEDNDAWELDAADDEIDCGMCGKPFVYSRETRTYYSTRLKKVE